MSFKNLQSYLQKLKAHALAGWPSIIVIFTLGLTSVLISQEFALELGPVLAPMGFNVGLVFIAAAAALTLMLLLEPKKDDASLTEQVMKGNVAAAVRLLGKNILFSIIIFCMVSHSRADEMPPNAKIYSPVLVSEAKRLWPEFTQLSLSGAQIEQETCPSLKSKMCWSPTAQLKTPFEQGVGFGQTTRAWDKTGKLRFDAMAELKLRHPKELGKISWDDWTDPQIQMRLYILKMRDVCKNIAGAKTQSDMFAMCLAAYNGGEGGLRSDRFICSATKGCDPSVWFGNVEYTSNKARKPLPGYKVASYDINRGYVKNVFFVRRPRYLTLDYSR
jgi:hypothetical protein